MISTTSTGSDSIANVIMRAKEKFIKIQCHKTMLYNPRNDKETSGVACSGHSLVRMDIISKCIE